MANRGWLLPDTLAIWMVITVGFIAQFEMRFSTTFSDSAGAVSPRAGAVCSVAVPLFTEPSCFRRALALLPSPHVSAEPSYSGAQEYEGSVKV